MARTIVTVLLCVAAFAVTSIPTLGFELTLDSVFGRIPPWGVQPSRIVWSPDARTFLYVEPTQDPDEALAVHQYDVTTHRDRIIIDPRRYGKAARTPGSLKFSPDSRRLAFIEGGALYVRDFPTGSEARVAQRAADPQWSPVGDALAFVRNADVYVVYTNALARARRVTRGGHQDAILNGTLDWVYPEELGTQHGYAWAPNGKTIAYMRMDERQVTAFPIVDFLSVDNRVAMQRYPLAGERNPRVQLRSVRADGTADRLAYDAGKRDEYLPFFGWNGARIVFETLDRAQQHLRVVACTQSA